MLKYYAPVSERIGGFETKFYVLIDGKEKRQFDSKEKALSFCVKCYEDSIKKMERHLVILQSELNKAS